MEITLKQHSLVSHWLIISCPAHVFIYYVIWSVNYPAYLDLIVYFIGSIIDHHVWYLVVEVFSTPCEYFFYIKKSICSRQLVIGKESMLSRVPAICIPLMKPDVFACTHLMHNQSKQLRAVILIHQLFSKEKTSCFVCKKIISAYLKHYGFFAWV